MSVSFLSISGSKILGSDLVARWSMNTLFTVRERERLPPGHARSKPSMKSKLKLISTAALFFDENK